MMPPMADEWGNIKQDGDIYSDHENRYARSMVGKTPSMKRQKAARMETDYKARGMGKTGKTHRPISDAEKMTMCLLRGQGFTEQEIADKLKRPQTSVSGVFKTIERQCIAQGLNYDWREVMEREGVAAVRAGLNCERDEYKRAAIGVQALKGIGSFEQESAVNLNQLIGQIPESQRSRYITLEPADPNVVTLESANAIQTQKREDDGFLNAQETSGDETGHP